MGELIRRETAAEPLGFSGERLTGAVSGQIEVEHYHRYLLARDLCRGRDVLDVAAGEGYGSALLAQVARSVVGVEIDAATVDAARREFARPNLRYEPGDARVLPVADASVDVVVSFETLEHLAEQDVFLGEIKRVLRPDGLLIISTPDRDVYSPLGAPPNPFHVLELTRGEFAALLGRHFVHHDMAGQRTMIGSVVLGTPAASRTFERRGDTLIEGSDGFARATYLLAVASDGPVPAVPASVFVHRSDLDTDFQTRIAAEHARNAAEAALAEAQAALAAARHTLEGEAATAHAATARALAEADKVRADTQLVAEAAREAEARAEGEAARAAGLERQIGLYKARLDREGERAQTALGRSEALEHLLAGAQARADAADAELAAVRTRAAEAEAALAATGERASVAEGGLADHRARLDRELAQESDARRRLHEIETSTAWRVSSPARRLGARHPRLARGLGRGVKLAWWTGTLQIGHRYVLWRNFRAAVAQASRLDIPPVPTVASEAPVPAPSPPPLPAPPSPPPPPAPAGPASPVLRAVDVRLATSVQPVVSVIVATYGQLALTLACLRSMADHPPSMPFEVLVVDDAYPGPEDMTELAAVRGIRVLRNPANLGFLRSCNRAAAGARGRYVFLLNNDAELRPGSLNMLVELLERRADAGMVGSRLLYPDGRQQEAGGILWDDASGWNYGRLQEPGRPEFNYVREVDYCSGASVLVRREVWDALGGFDEAFAPAYYEDADLACRVRAMGLKVLYQPQSTVIHHEGASNGTDLGAGIKQHQVTNQARMIERWRDVLRRENYRNGEHVLRARDRARTRKVALVIDHYTPEPDRDAGSRSIMGIMDGLRDAGWVVKFWPQNRVWTDRYARVLEADGIEVLDSRYPGTFDDWMRENGAELDHVLAVRPYVAMDMLPAIEAHTRAVLSFYGVDLHCARMRRQAALSGDADPVLLREADAMERLEREVWTRFDAVIYPSDAEAREVAAMAPGTPVHGIVPFWFDTAVSPAGPASGQGLLFVAGFAHPPNVDAAEFLMREVVPRVEAAVGPVTVTLAGSNPTEAVRRMAGPDVTVTGYVTDEELARLYASHRVAVVPLRFGAGVKGKVVEGLSRGLPLVTTSVGAQGIEGLGEVVPVHDDAEGMARALAALLTDDAAWRRQSAVQLEFAGRRFSRAAMGRTVLAAMAAGEAVHAGRAGGR